MTDTTISYPLPTLPWTAKQIEAGVDGDRMIIYGQPPAGCINDAKCTISGQPRRGSAPTPTNQKDEWVTPTGPNTSLMCTTETAEYPTRGTKAYHTAGPTQCASVYSWPTANQEDSIHHTKGSNCWGPNDCKGAFCVIKLAPEDKTVVATSHRRFRSTVMSQGAERRLTDAQCVAAAARRQ